MRNSSLLWIIFGIMLLMDIYIYQALKAVLPVSSTRMRTFIFGFYWILAVAALALLVFFPALNYEAWPRHVRAYVFAILIGLFFAKLMASLFLAIDDIRRGATWITLKMLRNPADGTTAPQEGITRSVFLSWIGFALGGGLFGTLLYGFTNKYNYQVKKIKLAYDNLPSAFKGLKILQISDVHAGSFMDRSAVQKGIEKILNENADIIVFTGDMVNDRADEMYSYIDVFNQLKAPMGVYSVLGNHDYGDYFAWPSAEEKNENLIRLKKIHEQLGWKLLLNEHVVFERDQQQIALLGVENWSAKARFPKHGKLSEAYAGTEQIPFKVLLSHDPSHWDAEVRTGFSDIDLTLSGHTHGMQFGVEIPGFKWSPVQYVYQQWAGLYQESRQKLYVNRGFGFIGYPGRIGILPEITVITLT